MAGAAALWAYVSLYTHRDSVPIRSDGYSYYVYLPSVFLYGDPTLEAPARDCCGGSYPQFTGITRWRGTGRWVNPHPIGPAVLMAPFFAAAHLLTRWSNLPPDGFSLYYQHAAGVAGLSYFLIGLAVLRHMLARHFTSPVVLATLATVTWGTNLFHYATFDATFSHAFSFFLITLLVALTERWWDRPALPTTAGVGITSALIVLTRHTSVIFLLMLPLYGAVSRRTVAEQAAALWRRRGSLAIIVVVFALGILPQLLLYRSATGSWLISPYAGLDVGLRLGSPHLFGVLFSTQKGLFFWSPVLLMAVAGLFTARGWAECLTLPAAIILMVDTYLIASWSDWQFGGSFGHRAFTDSFGLLAVFLAAFFAWAAERRAVAVATAVGTSLAVSLSLFQMFQYWMGALPYADTTWAQYRALFLKLP
jgi:hypothetical protein